MMVRGLKVTHDLNVEFEKVYRDRITGFTGKCIGTCKYVSGCDQVLIAPPLKEDGTYQEGRWFDDERLIDVEAERAIVRTSRRGADIPAPVK